MEKQSELHRGDRVKMYGQACIGEIIRVTNRYATVVFASMEVSIPLKQLEKVDLTTASGQSVLPIRSATRILNLANDALSAFNPEIDLHGMHVSSALNAIDQWLDQASLLGYQQLKIIHGKGTGTLRGAVRKHLQSHDQVKRVIDKYPYSGGAGVTCLEVA